MMQNLFRVTRLPLRINFNGLAPVQGGSPARLLRFSTGVQQSSVLHNIKCLEDGSAVDIEWDDGEQSRFHSGWLRLNCNCPNCKQSYSGQRLLDIASVPDPLTLKSVTENCSNQLLLSWDGEVGHVGELDLDWLKENSYSRKALEHRNQMMTTKPHLGKNTLPQVQYSDIVASDQARWEWMLQIAEHGISLVKNVPLEDTGVEKVAELIAPVMQTVYGKLFDVISTPDPINIAYSEVKLPFHMDLTYYESPPGLQLLHCLRFDPEVTGGESLFVDVFHVAEEMRKQYPDEFDTLVRVPATFQKIHFERERPVKLLYQRPYIVLNPQKEIVQVTWAPAFEGPWAVPEEDVEPLFEAYRIFERLIQESPIQKSVKAQPGDLLIFNNRRILHGRNEFKSNGGGRHLKGAYLNIDEFRSAMQALSDTIGDGRPCKRLGNHCFL